MTTEEYKKIETFYQCFKDSNEIISKKCKFIASEYARYDEEYFNLDSFSIDLDCLDIVAHGAYSCMGDWTEVERRIDFNLLFLSEDEIKLRVDNLIRREKEAQDEMLKKEAEREHQRDIAEFERLQKKLGFNSQS